MRQQACCDHLGNSYTSIKVMCEHYHISPGLFRARKRAGWNLEMCLVRPVHKPEKPMTDHVGNHFTSIYEMCTFYGITLSAFENRSRLGWNLEKTLTTPNFGDKGIRCVDHCGNSFDSIKDMCAYYDIPSHAYYTRKSLGWTLEQILTTPIKRTGCQVGETVYRTIKEFCEQYHISETTYRKYVKLGYNEEQIAELAVNRIGSKLLVKQHVKPKKVRQKSVIVDHLGNRYETKTEMARYYGVSPNTLRKRIKSGWSLEQALTTKALSFSERRDLSSKKAMSAQYQNNQGLHFCVIAYRSSNDCDIRFEDGFVLQHVAYAAIREGEVSHPHYPCTTIIQSKKKYEGQRYLTKYGMYITCDKYISSKHLECTFEDGVSVVTTSYAWIHDCIVHPYRSNKNESVNEIAIRMLLEPYGFRKKHKNSSASDEFLRFELDLYHPELKIAIEYDGYMHDKKKDLKKDKICKERGVTLYRIREPSLKDYLTSCKLFHLDTGDQLSENLRLTLNKIIQDINQTFEQNISCVSEIRYSDVCEYMRKNVFLAHVGEVYQHSSGMNMTIIKNEGNQKYTVQFEDWTIVEHKEITSIQDGYVRHPLKNSRTEQTKKKVMNAQFTMKNGEIVTIIDYTNALDCSCRFENGVEVLHIPLERIYQGNLTSERYRHGRRKDMVKHRIGTVVQTRCGLSATVVDYKNANRVICEFEDGQRINTSWQHFISGEVAHPSLPTKTCLHETTKKKMVGMRVRMKNGHMAECIEYIDCHHIVILFDNGMTKETKAYDFRQGLVSLPKQDAV